MATHLTEAVHSAKPVVVAQDRVGLLLCDHAGRDSLLYHSLVRAAQRLLNVILVQILSEGCMGLHLISLLLGDSSISHCLIKRSVFSFLLSGL